MAMKKRGYNRHTIFTCVGIAVLSYSVFWFLMLGLTYVDQTLNGIAYWWTSAWWVGTTFAIINLRESQKDRKAVIKFPRVHRAELTAADWYVRLDVIAVIVSLIMLLSGLASLFEATRVHIAMGLMIAGLVSSFSQAWNLADRLRLKRIIREDKEDAERRRKAIQG